MKKKFDTIITCFKFINQKFEIIEKIEKEFKLNIYEVDEECNIDKKNDICLYCINKVNCLFKIKLRNDKIVEPFCSFFCKIAFQKIIEIHLPLLYKSCLFFPPVEIFENKKIITE